MEEKLPSAQERTVVVQAVPLQPMGATWSRSPHAAMEEATVQQWMRPEGAAACGDTPQEPCAGAAAHEQEPMMGWRSHGEGAADNRDLCGAPPEGWALCTEPC